MKRTQNFNLRCVSCRSPRYLLVTFTGEAEITENGSVDCGSHEWSGDSPIRCDGCGWVGSVEEAERAAEFTVYTFDVKLLASIRVMAKDLDDAKEQLANALHCADTNFGAWPNGDPVTGTATLDGEPDLIEIDGEAT